MTSILKRSMTLRILDTRSSVTQHDTKHIETQNSVTLHDKEIVETQHGTKNIEHSEY